MYELPLFPLNTVLFPGAPLNLHIFEPRYRKMIQYCLDTDQPFGVVLIRQGLEAQGPLATPYEIGCSAEIAQVEHLPDGRMNLVVVGKERFRIHSLDTQSQPYLVGQVEEFPLEVQWNPDLGVSAARLRNSLERYLRFLVEAGISNFTSDSLPADPISLAYLSAALVQISQEAKQELLGLQDPSILVQELIKVYQKEVALVRVLLHDEGRSQGGFSAN